MASDGTNTYGYSAYNQLTSVSGAANATLAYDGGQRLVQTAGSSTTRFAYDGSMIAEELSTSSAVLRRYIPGPDGTPLLWYEGASNADRRWLMKDQLGSVQVVMNSSGASDGANTYDPYGQGGSANMGRFQFASRPWIPEAGLYDNAARSYSPTLGRFLQTDPIGFGDGMNIYAYTHDDPVNGSDPTGLANPNCPAQSFPGTPAIGQKIPTVCVDGQRTPQFSPSIVVDSGGGTSNGGEGGAGSSQGKQSGNKTPNCAGGSFSPPGSKLNVPNGYYYVSASLGLFAGVGGQVSYLTGIHVSGGVVVGSYSGFSFLAGAGIAGVAAGGVNASDTNPLGSGLSLTGQLGGGPASYSYSVDNSGNYAGQSAGGGPGIEAGANVGVAGGLSGSHVTCHVGN